MPQMFPMRWTLDDAPLHHLQVELIRRYRAGLAYERVQRGIQMLINRITADLRSMD